MDVTQIGYSTAGQTAIDTKSMAAASLSASSGSVFSEFLSGQGGKKLTSQSGKDRAASQTQDVKSDGAYNRYRYKNNSIDSAKTGSVSIKASELSDETAQLKEDAVTQIAQDLGVDEEAVKDAMETLGLTVLDLMQPQNLAALVKTASGMADDTQILLDDGFCQASSDVAVLMDAFAKENGLSGEQMDALAAELSSQGTVEEVILDPLAQEAAGIVTDDPTGAAKEKEDAVVPDEASAQEASAAHTDVVTEDRRTDQTKDQTQSDDTSEETGEKVTVESESPLKETDKDEDSSGRQESNDFSRNLSQAVSESLDRTAEVSDTSEITSYASVDAQDIIDQIVEQTKVTLGTDTTSIEMQLNPENLGKIFLNISAKEGAVTAQLFTQNESVQAALQAQIAELVENLNQAGVKVDAIEVSVAAHEFERNLEQGAKGDEEQGSREEEKRTGRKNLRIDSLDELSGLMTEEETLVARMMKDNGNSVDFTA